VVATWIEGQVADLRSRAGVRRAKDRVAAWVAIHAKGEQIGLESAPGSPENGIRLSI